MSTVRVRAGAEAELPAPAGRNVFLYVVEGEGEIGGTGFERWHLLRLNDDGETVRVRARSDTFLLFGHADPIKEPVVAHGPFVMNTREEIVQAFRDYEAGKFNGNGKLLEVGA
jgi:redox-sensitive bicupin YhaK (pirin superfamily)